MADVWSSGVTLLVVTVELGGLEMSKHVFQLYNCTCSYSIFVWVWSIFVAIVIVIVLVRYHFTTGKFPFEGETIYKLFHVITIGEFNIPPDLPPLLQELIKGDRECFLVCFVKIMFVHCECL